MLPLRGIGRRPCLTVFAWNELGPRLPVHLDLTASLQLDQYRKHGISTAKEQSRTSLKIRGAGAAGVRNETPSLMEQLFPEEMQRKQTEGSSGDIPRRPLPLPVLVKGQRTARDMESRSRPGLSEESQTSWRKINREIERFGQQTSVLYFRCATLNLMEEDFRRLAPQGQHISNWFLDDGILKVIPMRSWSTLQHEYGYYVLFRSQTAAYDYLTHVKRTHRVVASQTRTRIDSPLSPSKSFQVEGIDAHDALKSFTLIPACQSLNISHQRLPLQPGLWVLVKKGGHPSVTDRPDKKAFELRMTFEGPQLTRAEILQVLLASSTQRSTHWGGDGRRVPYIAKYEAVHHIHNPESMELHRSLKHGRPASTREPAEGADVNSSEEMDAGSWSTSGRARRRPDPVFIAGFDTERDMHTFQAYWHRRHMVVPGGDDLAIFEGDEPSIMDLKILW